MKQDASTWFAQHTSRAPERLRARAAELLSAETDSQQLIAVLAASGSRALDSAVQAGAGRTAALDLLTADALITLSLLAAAESTPTELGSLARALRLGAVND